MQLIQFFFTKKLALQLKIFIFDKKKFLHSYLSLICPYFIVITKDHHPTRN